MPGVGLYHLGHRQLAPGSGRFVSVDPAKDGGNWYRYVLSAPTSFTDGLGLQAGVHFPFPMTTPGPRPSPEQEWADWQAWWRYQQSDPGMAPPASLRETIGTIKRLERARGGLAVRTGPYTVELYISLKKLWDELRNWCMLMGLRNAVEVNKRWERGTGGQIAYDWPFLWNTTPDMRKFVRAVWQALTVKARVSGAMAKDGGRAPFYPSLASRAGRDAYFTFFGFAVQYRTRDHGGCVVNGLVGRMAHAEFWVEDVYDFEPGKRLLILGIPDDWGVHYVDYQKMMGVQPAAPVRQYVPTPAGSHVVYQRCIPLEVPLRVEPPE